MGYASSVVMEVDWIHALSQADLGTASLTAQLALFCLLSDGLWALSLKVLVPFWPQLSDSIAVC